MKQQISECLYIDRLRIPRVMLGTSPFIAAAQFGPKAKKYYEQFCEHPENAVQLIVEAADLGLTWVQAICYDFLIRVIEEAKNQTSANLRVMGTVGVHHFEQELEMMKNLKAEIILTHARITDRLDNYFSDCIEEIDKFAIAGVATHNPGITIPQLTNYHKVKIVLTPINAIGRYMLPSPNQTLEAIKNSPKVIMGKKTLAAGLLTPEEALRYVAQFVYGVVIGIASSQELKETFGIAKQLWKI